MKRWKMVSAAILAVAMGLCVLAGCGGSGDTFEGSVSSATYASQEEAVEGYFAAEINGSTTTATNIEVKSEEEVSQDELSSLPLGDIASEVRSAKKLTVTYDTETPSAALSASSGKYEQVFYLLELNDGSFRYFVPPTAVGDMISKSYYEDVFNAEKYANCTIESKQTITTSSGETSMTQEESTVVKITEEGIEMHITQGVTGEQSTTMDAYILSGTDGLVIYVNNSGSWVGVPMSMLSDMLPFDYDDLADFGQISLGGFMDHTYFCKTEDGFCLSSEKYMPYIQGLMGEMFGDIASVTGTAEMNYVVSEGRVSELTGKIDMTVAVSYMGVKASAQAKGSVEYEYSDFGSTSIEIPQQIIDLQNM